MNILGNVKKYFWVWNIFDDYNSDCDCRQPKNYKNPINESKNEQQEQYNVKWDLNRLQDISQLITWKALNILVSPSRNTMVQNPFEIIQFWHLFI